MTLQRLSIWTPIRSDVVVLNLFNRFFKQPIENVLTESVKPIFAMILNQPIFNNFLRRIRVYFCRQFLKVVENTIGRVVGSSKKVRKLGMTAWPYLN